MDKLKKHMLYPTWLAMICRCENPNYHGYKYYGGRGISVCERWHKFENFLADVDERPEGLTLDRWPDNDGNYEPSNIRWATKKEQCANSRKRHYPKRKKIKLPVHPMRVWRISQGWTIEQLAGICCYSQNKIQGIEKWRIPPRISAVLRLCDLSEGVLKPWDFLEPLDSQND